MHAALSLFEINRIGREIPVNHRMTPQVEVETLLPDRC